MSSSSSINNAPTLVHEYVRKQMVFLREHVKTLAGKLKEDEDLLGDTSDIRKGVLAKATKILEVEAYNYIMSEVVDRSIREMRAVEQQRRQLAAQLTAPNGNDGNNEDEDEDGNGNDNVILKKEQRRRIEPPPALTSNQDTKRKLSEIVDEAKQELERSAHSFPATQWYKGLEADLQTSADQQEDGDFTIQTTGPKDSDFTCPYTNVKFEVPMANRACASANACTHHVCQTALKVLLPIRKTSFKCPVSGCNATWTKGHIEADKAFARKMERHFATQKHTQHTQGLGGASDCETHEIEDEYTAV